MYKCLDCGHIFEEGEQRTSRDDHGLPGGYAEEFESCPVCGGDFEEARLCDICDEWHTEQEFLWDCICEQCAWENLNASNFLEFAKNTDSNGDEITSLEDFIFSRVFELHRNQLPSRGSAKSRELCEEIYRRYMARDLLLKDRLLQGLIVSYVKDCNLIPDFAEWLASERG